VIETRRRTVEDELALFEFFASRVEGVGIGTEVAGLTQVGESVAGTVDAEVAEADGEGGVEGATALEAGFPGFDGFFDAALVGTAVGLEGVEVV
jgi:hypothetical protein